MTRIKYIKKNTIANRLTIKVSQRNISTENTQINNNILNADAKKWHKIEWKKVYNKIQIQQEVIAKAATERNWRKVYLEQQKLIRSFEAAALAVRKVVTNSGGKTPGVDKIVLDNPDQYYKTVEELTSLVKNPKQYKASALKRVYIPKPGKKEMRGLGIPTIMDRVVQAIYHLALDPAVEAQSDLNSFGFRKERSTLDAISYFRNYMDKTWSPRWVLEADISKCFDRISHEFMMKHTPICDKGVLLQWLKSGVVDNGTWKITEEGTPQGGIISPTLANIALNGLEARIKNDEMIKKYKTPKIKVIRYADDIVITGERKEILERCKAILEEFLVDRNLELNQDKTRITNIEEGITLLGFDIKRQLWKHKYNGESKQEDVLIIRPSEKGITNIKNKIREIMKKENNMKDLAIALNPVLRGWAEHKRISPHSRRVFHEIEQYIWEKLKSKFVRRRTKGRVRDNYASISPRRGRWGSKEGLLLFSISRVKIVRHRLKKLDMNPYLSEHRGYFEKVREKKALNKQQEKLYKRYKNTCSVCGETLLGCEPVEIHHIKARKDGGTDNMNNLMPLHKICHIKITHEESK